MRRLLSCLLALVCVGLRADGDPAKETPSLERRIPVALGSVDAVSGGLSLRIPLGPRLPGRIPIGFTWYYEAQDPIHARIGGGFRPIVWPDQNLGLKPSPLKRTVLLNGQAMEFHTKAKPAETLPTAEAWLAKIRARGVDDGYAEVAAWPSCDGSAPRFTTEVFPSSDGTRFLLRTGWQVSAADVSLGDWKDPGGDGGGGCKTLVKGQRWILLDGPTSYWTNEGTPVAQVVTEIRTRWGDRVTIKEEGGNNGGPMKITLRNEADPTRPLVLDRSSGDLVVTNSFGLPEARLVGTYQTLPDMPNVPCYPNIPGAFNGGFRPTQWTETAPGGQQRVTRFSWWDDPAHSVTNPFSGVRIDIPARAYLGRVIHPSGLVEQFGFNLVGRLSSGAFDPPISQCGGNIPCQWESRGQWTGYSPLSDYDVPFYRMDHTYKIANPSGAEWGVTYVGAKASEGSSEGWSVLVHRIFPGVQGPTSACNTWDYAANATWLQRDHVTTLLRFATPFPASDSPYRGLRLTHQGATSDRPFKWGAPGGLATPEEQRTAYLFATSAVLREEWIHGIGAQWEENSIRSDFFSRVIPNPLCPSSLKPTAPVVERTRDYDGWDLRSWGNPTGSLAEGLPVNPVATRISVRTPNLPSTLTQAGDPSLSGSRDARGPVRTDETTEGPALPGKLATISPWNQGGSILPAVPDSPVSELSRTGTLTRHFDWNLLQLQVDQEQKTLQGSRLPELRKDGARLPDVVGVSSVDFGTTAFAFDSLGRVTRVTGARSGYSAVESREYEGNLPLLKRSTKTLSGPSGAVLPNPADPAVQVGKEYAYDTTPFRWLQKERDLTDGRWTTYVRDSLGRETSRTDGLGITVTTRYDAWGRADRIERLAKDGAGSVLTERFSDPAGLWSEESVTAEGRTLTTRSDRDVLGRSLTVRRYQGYGPSRGGGTLLDTQTTTFDGWGQRIAQSPALKPTQTPYGNHAWDYDDWGRVIRSRDPKGRQLSEVVLHPAWQPAQTVDGVALPAAVWSTARDDRGHTRSTLIDFLGQKVAVIDQKGQVSRYWYDQDGRLLRTQQGQQARWYRYDAMGWLRERFEPEEGSTLFDGHTLFGTPLLSTQKGRSGTGAWTARTDLNAWLLPAQVTASGPEGTVTRTFTYRADHLLERLSETQPQGTLTETYGYDGLYRPVSKTVSDGAHSFTLSRTLDALGGETSLTYPAAGGRAQQVLSRSYDDQFRPLQVQLAGSSRGLMAYDQVNGSAVSAVLTYGNGVTTRSKVDLGELVLTEHAVRDPGGILKDAQGNAVLLESNALAWTAGGLLLNRGGDSFQYDELQRLSSATTAGIQAPGESITQGFSYDRYGNRSGHAFTFTGSKPKEAVAYTAAFGDSNDLPESLQTAGGPVSTLRVYDALGRLTQVNAVPGAPDELTQWAYDPTGRITSETVNGVSSAFLLDGEGLRFRRTTGSTATYTLYGFNREPLMVFDKAGAGSLAWKKTLVYGFGQLLSEEKAGGTIYVQSDYVGSPNLLTDANGKVVGRTKNLPFGERYGQLGSETSTRRYTNHEDQPGSAIYMQARTYLPAYAKFAQVDPAYDQAKDDPESWNLYNYVTNNPVTKTDPDGRMQAQYDYATGPMPRGSSVDWQMVDDGFGDPGEALEAWINGQVNINLAEGLATFNSGTHTEYYDSNGNKVDWANIPRESIVILPDGSEMSKRGGPTPESGKDETALDIQSADGEKSRSTPRPITKGTVQNWTTDVPFVPEEEGVFSVLIHSAAGLSYGATKRDGGAKVTVRQIIKEVKAAPTYKPGMKIRLVACQGGAARLGPAKDGTPTVQAAPLAQRLADRMKITVLASPNILSTNGTFINENTVYGVRPVVWQNYEPGQSHRWYNVVPGPE